MKAIAFVFCVSVALSFLGCERRPNVEQRLSNLEQRVSALEKPTSSAESGTSTNQVTNAQPSVSEMPVPDEVIRDALERAAFQIAQGKNTNNLYISLGKLSHYERTNYYTRQKDGETLH
ncbi:MAG: hypothetical protein QOF93_1107, partial [Verrucomicrobiota bacterium]